MTDKPIQYLKPGEEIAMRGLKFDEHLVYARYEAAVLNAVFAVYIDPTNALIGYDPQKLLAPPDKRRTFYERMEVWRTYGDLEAHGLPRWGDPDASPVDDLAAAMEHMDWPHKLAVIQVHSDYSHIEARVLAAMADRRVRAITLDLESGGGEIIGPAACRKTDHQLRLYALGAMLAAKPATPPKRQPGYLKHDPTKRQRRWRPK